MMNRGKLEAWAVRLFMIRNRLRIPKAQKALEQKHRAVMVTRLNERALIAQIEGLINTLEVM